jgi:GAF domain-containing protein
MTDHADTPPVEECLLVPFNVRGNAVGTIWAVAHDERRKFDAEDLRQLKSLGQFAAAAYQAVTLLDEVDERDEVLRRKEIQLTRQVDELQAVESELRRAMTKSSGSR